MPDQTLDLEVALAAALADLNAAKERIAQLEVLSDLGERLVDTGSFQMDWDTMQVRWSDNTFRIFGISREEFGKNYKSVAELIHPDDRASFDATMARVIATHEPYAHTHRIVRPNGEIRHVREVASTVGGVDGNLFLGITQDITEIVETKAAEADLQALVKLAGEVAKVGGWKVDLDSQIVEITPVTASIIDMPDLRTLPLSEAFAVFTEESTKRLNAAFAHSIETGNGFDEILTLVSRIGHQRTVRFLAIVERDPETHRIIGLTGAIKDITELSEARGIAHRSAEFALLAERVFRLGGWRFDVSRQELSWSTETAIIHDVAPGKSPSLDESLAYYIPEHRPRIQAAVADCIENGRPFDEVLQIITAKGRNVWIRAIGEAVFDRTGQIVMIQGAIQDITDQVAERSASEKLARRLQQTLENISDAFFLLDADWRFSFVNSQAEVLLQRRRDDILGKVIWDLYPESVGSTFQTNYERAVQDGGAVRFEEFFTPLNIWMQVNAYATPEGLSVYFRDVTEQRARDEQLRLLQVAVSHQNDILLITEADPVDGMGGPPIVYVNEAFERLTGYSRTEVIGKTPSLLQGPKTQRDELDRIKTALINWEPVRAELINYKKSGEEFWVELDIVPVANETGWYTHWIALERDITARKNAEMRLQTNEERFRLVTKAAGSAIWDWDAAANKLWWSDGMLDIFGHQPDPSGTIPTVWRANVHPEDIDRVDAANRRLEAGQDNVLRLQYRFRRADGSWACVEDHAFSIRDANGEVCRILGSMTDVSEQRMLAERLRQAQKMEAVGQLTGGVAHDFNNLLTIILGNSELLDDALSDQPQLQRLARMSLEAADRGADLTSRLLAFSRKQPLEPKVVDMAQLIQGLEVLLRRTLPENIAIELVRSGGLWKAEVDASQLESAILNLVVNARDAMPNGGSLTIEVANAMLDDDYVAAEPDVRPGQYVVLVVTDTGSGMTPDVLARVFEPFFTTKSVGKGSGLGLSMVFGFVKQSGGHIRIYSELDEGTAVKLYFPRARTEQATTASVNYGKRTIGGSETILVVEDDPAVRDYVTAQLQGLGYRVLEASAGAEALDMLRQTPEIDLLFTDVVMPGGMGGRELAEAARGLRPDMKILYTSGYTENSIVHQGRLDPGIKLLNKPYRREQLAAKVREALDEPEA